MDTETLEQGLDTSLNSTPDNQEQGNSEQKNQQEISDWKSDKRHGSFWKNENDLYKSYKSLEKEHTPLAQKYSEAEKQLTELKKYQQETSQYQDAINFIKFASSNEKYAPMVKQLVDNIAQEEKRAKFGDLPDDVIQRMSKGEEALSRLDQFEQTQKQEAMVKEYSGILDTNLSRISDLAKSENIEWSEDIEKEFLKSCEDQIGAQKLAQILQIDNQYLIKVFKEISEPYIRKSISEKSEKTVLGNLNRNKISSIPSSNSKASISPKNSNPFNKFSSGLEKALGI